MDKVFQVKKKTERKFTEEKGKMYIMEVDENQIRQKYWIYIRGNVSIKRI